MAKVTIRFDAWKDGNVAATTHDIPVVLPKSVDFKLLAVSPRLKKELIHPNKSSTMAGIRFSPDGKRLVAGDYPGGVVCTWDVGTAKRLTTIDTGKGYRGSSNYFSVTADWSTLFVASEGKAKYERVEKDGKTLIRCEYDGSIRSWNLNSGELLRTYRHDPPRYIHTMDLSPDGTKFVTAEWRSGIRDENARAGSLWDAQSGKSIELNPQTETYSRFSPDSKMFASVIVDKEGHSISVALNDVATGKTRVSIPVSEKRTTTYIGQFSADNKLLLVSHQTFGEGKESEKWRYRLDVHETATGKKVASLTGDPDDHLHSSISPDGQLIGAFNWRGKERKLMFFSVPENRVRNTISFGIASKGKYLMTTQRPCFSPDGKWYAISTHELIESWERSPDPADSPQPRIHLIDVASGEIRETMITPQAFIHDLCFSPDGRTLAVGGHGRVLLFDVAAK